MKSILLLVIYLGAVFSQCPVLYEHEGYGGRSLKVCSDIDNLVPLGWNDLASSIYVPPNYKVTLYEHVGYGGRAYGPFSRGGYSIVAQFNDIASSLKVVKG